MKIPITDDDRDSLNYYDYLVFSDRDAKPCLSCGHVTKGVIVDEQGDFYSPPFHDVQCEECHESVLDEDD